MGVYFTNGYAVGEYGMGRHQIVDDEEMEAIKKLPDPDNVGNSYQFCEGVDHNEITLTREDAIEGMRAYIQRRGDNLIMEV